MMLMKYFKYSHIRKSAATILCIVMMAVLLLPVTAHSENETKKVRVGWYESPFNMIDKFGRRSGYAYEYQRKIAAYTGWNYEYVTGTWSQLMEMLENGEIDLMSDVSYKADRAEKMLYSSLPMGTEIYHVFASPDNTEISADNFSTLNGKRIGVTRNSIQKDLFISWAENHNIEYELFELTSSEDESLGLITQGKLDAFITLDSYANEHDVIPVCKIGSSDFYFVVNKNRPDLLNELDYALNLIQDENRNYNQTLYEKYLRNNSANLLLSTEEKQWLEQHGTIRVGYQDNYLAFCAKDPDSGELIGALKDFLDYASDIMNNAKMEFEAIAYPSASAALEALQNGEVDCMFPANLSDYDGEQINVVMTPALMTTEMDAVVRDDEQKEFIRRENVTVAVNKGNTNYEMFLVDNYPGWIIRYFDDTPSGLEGVANGEADCVIISNYRYTNIAKQCEKLHLATVYTGVNMEYCMALREGDRQLYSIMSKVTDVVPESVIHAALTYYSTEDAKVSFTDIMLENIIPLLIAISAIVLLIMLLLLKSIRAERLAIEEEKMVSALNKRVFIDALTSVKNKGAFAEYIQELQDKMDSGEPLEFAIGVFDCDDLKQVNDQYGHDKGDMYLKAASRLICQTFKQSPVFRIGGDEFAVLLQNEDYRNREELVKKFEDYKEEISHSTDKIWEQVRVSMGIAVYDPTTDRSIIDTSRRADKYMYENKRLSKEKS